jgi:hypothetical protein
LQVAIVPDGTNQQASLRLAGNDCGTVVAPFPDCRSRIKPQRSFLLFRPVTVLASLDEDGSNFCFKELLIRVVVGLKTNRFQHSE